MGQNGLTFEIIESGLKAVGSQPLRESKQRHVRVTFSLCCVQLKCRDHCSKPTMGNFNSHFLYMASDKSCFGLEFGCVV